MNIQWKGQSIKVKDVEAALQQCRAHCTHSTFNNLQGGLSPNVTLLCGKGNDLYNLHVLINTHICTAEIG